MVNREATLIRYGKMPGRDCRRGLLVKAKNGHIRLGYMLLKSKET